MTTANIVFLAGAFLVGFGIGALMDMLIRGSLSLRHSQSHLDHIHLAQVHKMYIVSKANHARLAKALADIQSAQIGGRVVLGFKAKGSDHGPR